MKKVTCLLAIMLSLCLGSVAQVQAADGLTPAEETVCDKAYSGTGALWGLCNAYCEAMDCDGKAVDAADAACAKVYENFIAKSGGKKLPCGVFGKPCKLRCDNDYQDDYATCKKQYAIAYKTCKDDSCYLEAKIILDNCIDNAKVSFNLCYAEKCYLNECAADCYDLHLKADANCYADFCKNDVDCDLKLLDACLDNNVSRMEICLKECPKIIYPK